ncbi:hypothetical protein [Erwinia sp. E_sp_B04_7]|uniref:hypothetical protein n=1 Tax=unclassified Erwinia TaxID=2622719 RepID=UPI0030D1FE8B
MRVFTLVVVSITILSGYSAASDAESTVVFNGQKFLASFTEHCSEGDVSCENVTLESKSKKTGKGVSLKGKTVNVNCPEVCDFRGYEFHNGAYKYYFVAGNADRWNLNIFKNGKVISTDIGTVK